MLPPIDLACDPICRGESLNRPTHAIRNPCLVSIADALSLSDLSRQLENYLVNQYLVSPHSTTGQAPQTRWEAGGFLPQMPESLEKRRTHVIRICPNEASSLRLLRALAVEMHENWLETPRYLNMEALREQRKTELRDLKAAA